ncbi:MAG TPA: hypothetical protein VK395_07160 [Gemmataceae bacterium]|nr:hypothetical protein [Gemmataceae bacterium]
MPRVRFLGFVHPMKVIKVLVTTPEITWKSPDIGLDATFTVQIRDSAVQVDCETNRAGPGDFIHLYFRAFDLSRASVDLISFATGIGLTVVLETFIDERGVGSPMVPQDPGLKSVCTAYMLGDPASYDAVWRIVVATPALFMALNDLITGIILPHQGARIAGQILETIRDLVSPDGLKPKQKWPHMQQNLRIEEAYLKFISTHATGPRHGDRSHIPPDITRELAMRSWVVMNRFLEFKKRGGAPLPASEFPMLS